MKVKISDVISKLGVSHATIGNWIKWHPTHFSDGAKLRRKELSERDLDTLATINRLSNEGRSHERIGVYLANGGELDEFEKVYVIDDRAIPVFAAEQMIDATEVRKELELKEAALNSALSQLATKDELILSLKDEIAELREQLGTAKAEARIYKKMAGQDDD